MADNRPKSREKYVTDNSKGVARRGSGLSGAGSNLGGAGNGGPGRSAGLGGGAGSKSLLGTIGVLAIAAILYFGGSLMGGSGQDSEGGTTQGSIQTESTGGDLLGQLGNLFGSFQVTQSQADLGNPIAATQADGTDNAGVLNTSVAKGTREKYTSIVGSGADQVTVMIYLIGTDLESKSGMATNDLVEMTKARLNDQVNVIVYTGGCNKWKNDQFSNSTNQIWKVTRGGVQCLVQDDGNRSMTKADTLTDFIKWCHTNYPANRQELILWDHGGGSITGYGHDERSGHSGSLTLADLDGALSKAGTKFDFIGFDACLMGTLENGLMLEPYADYLIASEETEPGIGWYYTNWLTALADNTSLPTIEIGKQIIDDFVTECNRNANRQKTTLSIVDLGELAATVPGKFRSFASSLNEKLQGKEFAEVSNARYQTREFGQSCSVDQVDLVDFARKIGNNQGEELAQAVLSCVKYNRTSGNMNNSYGVSVYFPYHKTSRVGNAVSTYKSIGMDQEYMKCISSFANIEVSGQSASSGTTSPAASLFGAGYGDNGLSSLGSILGMLTNREIPQEEIDGYVKDNRFDASALKWKTVKGRRVISLPEKQWSLVHDLAINMFYDDGTGYIDLGLDNLFSFDEDGNLIGDEEPTWLAIDGQPVAYYYEDTVTNGEYYSITGRVPALLNGDRVDLILNFDSDNPKGYIAGARSVYGEDETQTVAKALIQLKAGDKLDFICNYYDYQGNFNDSYFLGEQMTLSQMPVISNVAIEGTTKITYRFTDIYNQTYWTPVME